MLDPQTTALLAQLGFDAAAIESAMSVAILLSVVAIVAAVPTAILARRKGRSRVLWILLALSIPVLPLLLVWFLPAVAGDKPPDGQ